MVIVMGKFASLILYLTIYSLSALFLYFAARSPKKTNRVVIALIAILLPCIMAGIRYGVGVDYHNYRYMYQQHAELTFTQYLQYDRKAELGTYLLIKIAALFNSQQVFFTLFAFVIYAPIAKMIMERGEKSDIFFLALFCFF